MSEEVYMYVATKGGESYCRKLGEFPIDGMKSFDSYKWLSDRMQYEGGMLQVDDDCYVSMDCIARVRFDRQEVH